jgi:hypothetical protein
MESTLFLLSHQSSYNNQLGSNHAGVLLKLACKYSLGGISCVLQSKPIQFPKIAEAMIIYQKETHLYLLNPSNTKGNTNYNRVGLPGCKQDGYNICTIPCEYGSATLEKQADHLAYE